MCPSPSWRGLEIPLSNPLQRCSSLVDPLVLHCSSSTALHGSSASPLSLVPCSAPLLSPDALQAALLPSLTAPRCSSSRSTAAAIPFQIEQTTVSRWRNRADGDEEMAKSRGCQHAHKAARHRLTPKASQERSDA